MAHETYTTPLGTIINTPVCRRCGRAFPLAELIDSLCTDDVALRRYGSPGCMDEDEYTAERDIMIGAVEEEVTFDGEPITIKGEKARW